MEHISRDNAWELDELLEKTLRAMAATEDDINEKVAGL